jgi:hypothetical protein
MDRNPTSKEFDLAKTAPNGANRKSALKEIDLRLKQPLKGARRKSA